MKYVKPLQLFVEMRKPCPADDWLVVGLTSTARHLCWALTDSDAKDIELHDYYPHKTKCIVEKLSSIQNEAESFGVKECKVIGIVAGKNSVGPPMELLIEDLCKSGKFKSLKYTYWGDNIVSANSKSLSELYVEQHNKFFSSKSKRDDTDGFSAFRMLQGYMDLWNTIVERPKTVCHMM